MNNPTTDGGGGHEVKIDEGEGLTNDGDEGEGSEVGDPGGARKEGGGNVDDCDGSL